jgi:hypothetical protein
MALINCPDCGKQVSDQAAACLRCGAPIAAPAPVQTIEQTGKRYKAQLVVGILALLTGVIMINVGEPGSATKVFGIIITLIGAMMYIFSRIGAWWDHK